MAGTYNIIREYSADGEADDISENAYAVMAVVRLAHPLSYSRKIKASVEADIDEGAKARGKTLIITSDIISLQVTGQKEQHLKQLQATLIQSHSNYLIEILPGDWVLSWMVHGLEKQRNLIERIKVGKACNGFSDGFKFLGRIESVRKNMSRDTGAGSRNTRYNISAFGFRELDSQIFYDHNLAESSVEAGNLGRWLFKVGLDIRELFAVTANNEQADNVHLLIPSFLELLVGRGVGPNLNSTNEPALQQATGGGSPSPAEDADTDPANSWIYDQVDTGGGQGEFTVQSEDEAKADIAAKAKSAPYAYLVPKEVGDLLGKVTRGTSSVVGSGILAYADILELVFGVQTYTHTGADDAGVFIPDIDENNVLTKGNQRYTGVEMMGAFLPFMPNFDNTPLWNVLQQYLNPVVNEMYTCLRVNERGAVVPTVVLRQIPFTTDVLADKIDHASAKDGLPPYTAFSNLPQWKLSGTLVTSIDIGRSDASRCNFVHVYGQNADVANHVQQTDQLAQNRPIRDDLDIQRSGLHTYMTTVACRTINQIGSIPGRWMELIADHRIGSQFTLNGTIVCKGIQAPICEGDNLLFDGTVYHIEGIAHSFAISGDGHRSRATVLTVTNGLRDSQEPLSDTDEKFPVYPGFDVADNTKYDPGISVDDDSEENENNSKTADTDDTSDDIIPFDPEEDS